MSASGIADNSLVKRVVVGIFFAPLLVWFFRRGGYPFFAFVVFLTAFGQWELFRMLHDRLRFVHRLAGFISGMLIIIGTYIMTFNVITGIIIAFLVFIYVVEIVTGKEHRLENIVLSLFVTVYPALFIACMLKLSLVPDVTESIQGRYILLFMLFVIWIFDTLSYFSGRLFGKHSFFQSISPKKTVEGFCGGIAGVIVFAVGTGIYAGKELLLHAIVFAVLVALAGQAGDLSVSIIKRDRGVKDSSNLIPGHGGILDRFDSLIFASPVAYAYVLLVIRFSGGNY
ncbi:MAG: phosphatidate cytidylyltransferase [Candidatus Latescibacteria bacterium]|nr:phosphatidate cytidylyltransferase [Candidatus Latescibacterota bacterium]